MTEFLRVSDEHGNQYDAPREWVEAWPESFTVLDDEPVYTAREPKLAPKKRASKKPEPIQAKETKTGPVGEPVKEKQ